MKEIKLRIGVTIFILLFLVVPAPALAQTTSPLENQWHEVYGDFFVSSIVQTQDVGVILVGSAGTHSPVLSLMKLNSDNNVEWTKTYPEAKGRQWFIQEVDSGYLLSAYGNSAEVLKIDFSGNFEWAGPYDLWNTAQSIAEDGSYVIVNNVAMSGNYASSVRKYDADGVLLWEKFFYKANIEVNLQLDSSDGYYVAGTIYDGNSLFGGWTWRFWFAKLDLDGEVVWSRSYNYKTSGSTHTSFYSVSQTLDGGFLLSGFNDRDSWVVKTDRNGREQWHWHHGNLINEFGSFSPVRFVVQDESGQYLVSNGYEIIVLDKWGNELWVESCFEYLGEFENLVVRRVWGVSSVVGDGGRLVVAVTFSVDAMSSGLDGSYGVWVANFVVEPFLQSGSSVLLFGVVVVVVVGVFVGLIVYLKKYRYRK
ncbi:MAG: hypothetical protein LBE76_02910 [Nitrososphaerota archaeon]|nr:hypothetical protein [Nitrososphaerota archaeon]